MHMRDFEEMKERKRLEGIQNRFLNSVLNLWSDKMSKI